MGAAALWTTPTDLSKIIIEMQLALEGRSNKILSQKTMKLMTTPWKEGQNNAMGTFIDNQGEISYFQHSGGNEGFNCLYYASMEQGHGAVVMINSEKFELINEIMRSIAQAYDWSTFLTTVIDKATVPSDEVLRGLTGTYRSVDFKDRTVSVSLKKGHLFIEEKKRWKSELISQDKNIFITSDINPPATITFETGKLTIEQGGKYEWIKE